MSDPARAPSAFPDAKAHFRLEDLLRAPGNIMHHYIILNPAEWREHRRMARLIDAEFEDLPQRNG